MLIAAATVTVFALATQVRPEPWYHPRYALPLLGMVLGNTMTGISLGVDTLTTGLVRERAAVEARLALGASRYEALLPVVRAALRSGLMPIVNGMAAAGVVALPGMMTGQILAGASAGPGGQVPAAGHVPDRRRDRPRRGRRGVGGARGGSPTGAIACASTGWRLPSRRPAGGTAA